MKVKLKYHMDLNDLTRTLIQRDNRETNPFSSPFPESAFGFAAFPELSIYETQGFKKLYNITGDRELTILRLTSFFWEVFFSSALFRRILEYLKIPFSIRDTGKSVLSMQRDDYETYRYELLILSPLINSRNAFSTTLKECIGTLIQTGVDPSIVDHYLWVDLQKWKTEMEYNWSLNRDLSGEENRDDLYIYLRGVYTISDPFILRELIEAVSFKIIFAPLPKTVYTSGIPYPACGITLPGDDKASSSVGIVAKNEDGEFGVTAAFHGMHANPEVLLKEFRMSGINCLTGKEVFVGKNKGIITNADDITDSCFIKLEETDCPIKKPFNGVMSIRPPYRTELVSFEGITSTRVTTNVTEVDLGIPGNSYGRQRCVYTKPVTNRGDSGAALTNNDDELIGFAFRRTGYGEPVEYSEWIWADSVFSALNLKL